MTEETFSAVKAEVHEVHNIAPVWLLKENFVSSQFSRAGLWEFQSSFLLYTQSHTLKVHEDAQNLLC